MGVCRSMFTKRAAMPTLTTSPSNPPTSKSDRLHRPSLFFPESSHPGEGKNRAADLPERPAVSFPCGNFR